MRRTAALGLGLVAIFSATVVARLPAKWLQPLLPAQVACSAPGGTIWRGSCADLVAGGNAYGAVTWELHPLRLFIARLAATVTLKKGSDLFAGEIDRGIGGRIRARDVDATVDLANRLLPQLPPTIRGRLRLELAGIDLAQGRVNSIEGRIEVRDLAQSGTGTGALGSYELVFEQSADATGQIIGKLRDLGGPLSVTGTVALTPEPGYQIDGLVAPTASTPPSLVKQLEFLGTPDATGRRPFSLAGTL